MKIIVGGEGHRGVMGMKPDDVGTYWTRDEEDIWELIVYCEYPSATLKNLKTGVEVRGAVDSPLIRRFVKLIPEKNG